MHSSVLAEATFTCSAATSSRSSSIPTSTWSRDAKLLMKHAPDNEQRLHHRCQIGQVLDQLLDPALELCRPDHPDFEAEVE